MSQIQAIEGQRKASLLSILSSKYEEKRKISHPADLYIPKDKFHLVHITAGFIGFMTLMPVYFFSVASNYWMYKFRNSSLDSDTTAGEDRTKLQSQFQSLSVVAQTVPVIVFMLITLKISNISVFKKTAWSLFGIGVVFTIFSIFAEVNTDSWQTEFFILTMVLFFLNIAFSTIFQLSAISVIARLPQDYLFYYIIGQNGTLGTNTLQLISISLTDSSVKSGLMYFILGTFLIALTLVLFIISRRTEVFKYYVAADDTQIKENSPVLTFSDVKSLSKKIWPCELIIILFAFATSCIHPSVTTLVVSEYESSGSAWSTKYFTVVTVFLLFDIFSIIGKLASRKLPMTESNKWWFIGLAILNLVAIPGYIFSNAQPRTLPVILNHDWEFIVLNTFLALLAGVLINATLMGLKSFSPDHEEKAFLLINICISVSSTVFCGNGFLVVNLLSAKKINKE